MILRAVPLLQGPLWVESEADGAHDAPHRRGLSSARRQPSKRLGEYKGDGGLEAAAPVDLKSLGRPGGRIKQVKLGPAMRVLLMTAQLAAASPI